MYKSKHYFSVYPRQGNGEFPQVLKDPLLILTLCSLMDFSINIDTISMGLSILILKGSQVEIS